MSRSADDVENLNDIGDAVEALTAAVEALKAARAGGGFRDAHAGAGRQHQSGAGVIHFLLGLAIGLWVAALAWIWSYARGYKAGVAYCTQEMAVELARTARGGS